MFNIYTCTADFRRLLGRALEGDSRALDGNNNIHFYRAGEVLESACVGHRNSNAKTDYEPIQNVSGFTFEESTFNAAAIIAERFNPTYY